MMRLLFALLLLATPALAADSLYSIYAAGRSDAAMRVGAALLRNQDDVAVFALLVRQFQEYP
jgi:hypothetical protein